MATSDPLTNAPGSADRVLPDRPFYAAGVLLDAPDFTAEQLYHRGRLARALFYLHGSGTVSGLRVVFESAVEPGGTAPPNPDIPDDVERTFPEGREARILVQPGLAIDRLGRLIELPAAACLRLQPWLEDQQNNSLLEQATHPATDADANAGDIVISSDRTNPPLTVSPTNRGIVADVFIRFTTCETAGKTPAFGGGPFDSTNANVPARLRDSTELSLVLRTENTADLTDKLPRNPWTAVNTLSDLDNTLLSSWRETSDHWQSTRPNSQERQPTLLAEHTDNQDSTALFLARLLIRIPEDDTPPTARIDNLARQFVYPPSAIAHLLSPSP